MKTRANHYWLCMVTTHILLQEFPLGLIKLYLILTLYKQSVNGVNPGQTQTVWGDTTWIRLSGGLTSSMSVQWLPLPTMPSGQGPHFTPSGVSLHSTPGWQGLGTQEGRVCSPPIPGEGRTTEWVKGTLNSRNVVQSIVCWFVTQT